MRKFACCYAQGRPGAREFRTRASRVSSPDEFRQVVAHYFPRYESLNECVVGSTSEPACDDCAAND